MELFEYITDIILHLDIHLLRIVNDYRYWSYLILFMIIYCETGLVITPFLPGDSLLFAAGALAAIGALNLWFLILLLCVAAILGDSTNYSLGKYFGKKAFETQHRFFKKEYLIKTHRFYERHGGKTIIIARFVPIIRTFAPFIAGIGRMHYGTFLFYNISGGIFWVIVCTFAGYLFGNIPIVKTNFSMVVLVIIAISLLPVAFEYFKYQVLKIKA